MCNVTHACTERTRNYIQELIIYKRKVLVLYLLVAPEQRSLFQLFVVQCVPKFALFLYRPLSQCCCFADNSAQCCCCAGASIPILFLWMCRGQCCFCEGLRLDFCCCAEASAQGCPLHRPLSECCCTQAFFQCCCCAEASVSMVLLQRPLSQCCCAEASVLMLFCR